MNLLIIVWWPIICPILVKVLCALEKMYPAVLGLSVVQMSIWLIVLCKYSVSLLIFFSIIVLSIIEKSPNVIVAFSIYPVVLLVFPLCILKFCYLLYRCLEFLCLLNELTPLSFWNNLSYFCCYLLLWNLLQLINIPIKGFLPSITIVYLSHYFTFNLLVSLYLKLIAWR